MDRAFHPAVDNLVDTGDGKNAVVCIRKPGQIGWRGVERLRYRSISLSRYPVARGAGSKKLGPPRIFFRLRVQNINRPYESWPGSRSQPSRPIQGKVRVLNVSYLTLRSRIRLLLSAKTRVGHTKPHIARSTLVQLAGKLGP